MKRKRFPVERVPPVLQQVAAGVTVARAGSVGSLI